MIKKPTSSPTVSRCLHSSPPGWRYGVVLDAQRPLAGPVPFTLEGAIHFHRVQQVLEQGRLPEMDRNIEYPHGIRVSATDTVADTYLLAVLSKMFPTPVPLAERVRWIEVAWFCLGIPLLALWIGLRTRSWWGGLWPQAFMPSHSPGSSVDRPGNFA